MARLATLVPPPRVRLTRFCGVFAAYAALRAALPGRKRDGARQRAAAPERPIRLVGHARQDGLAAGGFAWPLAEPDVHLSLCIRLSGNVNERGEDNHAGNAARVAWRAETAPCHPRATPYVSAARDSAVAEYFVVSP